MKYEKDTSNSHLIETVLPLIKKSELKICDVGGATGKVLNEIIIKSPYKINAYLLDVFKKYQKRLINKRIHFIYGSIINNKLKSNSFNIVILRDVLHHLIGGGKKETQENQRKALEEMIHITKIGGYIVFEEEINNSVFASKIIFYLSKTMHKLNLSLLGFNLGKVVVSFMSQGEIEDILNKHSRQIKIIKKDFTPLNFPLRWRLTLLMNRVGHLLYIIKKTSE